MQTADDMVRSRIRDLVRYGANPQASIDEMKRRLEAEWSEPVMIENIDLDNFPLPTRRQAL